ncbi:TPA: glycosyltransferase family 4 protein [Kluyvera ascorbata F0526]|nr:glycosyltransferase family 4 protein [Kluyvera ascorbata F0526]
MNKSICYFINSAWYFELHWLERANAAIRSGYNVSLVAKFDNPSILARLEEIGIKCYESNINENNLNPFGFVYDCMRTFKLLNRINPDILHSITIKPGVISCLWCKLKNKQLIYSFVGLGRVFENNTMIFKTLRYIIIHLYRVLFSGINCKITFEHKTDQEKILKLIKLDPNKTIVIDGAGVDLNHFSYHEEFNGCSPKVLFASRMLWSKGLADLLKVKKQLNAEGIDFELLVAGIIVENDNDAIALAKIEEWHCAGEITWLGTRNDIKELIQESNIVALPSVYAEGIPRILLEAGAVGRATITYDIGGCNSLIKDGFNGILVERKNIEQFASKLKWLIQNDKTRCEMGLNARARIEEKYSSEIIVEQTLRLYQPECRQ